MIFAHRNTYPFTLRIRGKPIYILMCPLVLSDFVKLCVFWPAQSVTDAIAVAENDQNMMQFGRTFWLLNVSDKV